MTIRREASPSTRALAVNPGVVRDHDPVRGPAVIFTRFRPDTTGTIALRLTVMGASNLILTPHSSGGFMGFAGAVADLFIENLQRYLAGDALLNLVDPDRGY